MNLIEGFRQWLIEDGKSPRTIDSYCSDVKQFQLYLTQKAADEQLPLSRFSFVRYKQHLQERNLAISKVNKAVNSHKVYNDFLQKIGFVEKSFIQLKRDQTQVVSGSEYVVTAMSEEVEQLLFYVENQEKVIKKNKLVVYILLYTGVRVSVLGALLLVTGCSADKEKSDATTDKTPIEQGTDKENGTPTEKENKALINKVQDEEGVIGGRVYEQNVTAIGIDWNSDARERGQRCRCEGACRKIRR
jgi:hypothetical protein